MTSMLEELQTLTLAETADALRLEHWRLREMIKKGKAPPFFKVGRTFRFPLIGVRTWLAEQISERKEGDDATP